jgi:hypothetical protein
VQLRHGWQTLRLVDPKSEVADAPPCQKSEFVAAGDDSARKRLTLYIGLQATPAVSDAGVMLLATRFGIAGFWNRTFAAALRKWQRTARGNLR